MSDIEIKSNNKETIKSLTEILDPLIDDRRSLIMEKTHLEKNLETIKDDISMIDAEIQATLDKHNVEEFKGLGIHAQSKTEITPRITDFFKAFEWIKKNNKWDLLRADFLKRRDVINLLDKEGLNIDGVEMGTYTKFKVK